MNTTSSNPWTTREANWAKTFLAASGFTLPSPVSRRPSSGFIRDHVAIIYGLDNDRFMHDRHAECVQARQIAMFLAREQTLESFPKIAMAFGKRDHTTVMYSCERIRDRCDIDAGFAKELALVRTTIAKSYEAYCAAVESDLQAKAS